MSVVMAMEGVNLSFKIGSGPRAAHKQVLDNLSFAVRRGEAFGFLGPSGAGKTTTIKLLTRQLKKMEDAFSFFVVLFEKRAMPTMNVSEFCLTRALSMNAYLSKII